MDISTKQYLQQIQSIFKDVVKHYKSNVRTNREVDDEKLKELEQLTNSHFSPNLKYFLEWLGVMPIWQAPFLPFTENGKDFYVWSNRLEIIKIKLTAPHYRQRMELMHGNYTDNNSDFTFSICYDFDGNATNKKEAIFIEYGKQKVDHRGIIDGKSKIIPFADNIDAFLIKYLSYLKSIPVKKSTSPKLEKLLTNHKKLFKYVTDYNWDDGIEEMEYIANNPKCDKATALIIYWLCVPYYFDDKLSKELNLLPYLIENNFQKNFYQNSESKFDPQKNQFEDFIANYQKSTDKKRKIPDEMLRLVI